MNSQEAASSTPQVTIYALTDPDSGEVRYVGRTTNNPWQRYSQHLMGIDKATKAWIRGLRPERKVPDLKILEEQISADGAGSRERYWIDYWRAQGARLLNYLRKPPSVRPARVCHAEPIILASPGSLAALLQMCAIHRPIDLARALDIDRRYAWMLWQGKRQFTPTLALRLYERKCVPIHELFRAPADPKPLPRGRPRKSKDDQES